MRKLFYIIGAAVLAVALITAGIIYYVYSNSYVATVNGQRVTKAEYNFFIYSIKDNMEQTAGLSADTDKKAFWASKIEGENAVDVLKDRALDEAKAFKLSLVKAKENKIALTKEEEKQVDDSLSQQISGYGSRLEADKMLKAQYGINADQWKAIAKDIVLVYQKMPSEEKKNIQVSDEEAKSYYDTNKQSFDKVTVRHVLLATVDLTTYAPLSQDKQDAAKKNADEILLKVKSGEDIGALAKQYSEDAGSKDNNGEYTFGKGEMVAEFEDWAFKANEGDSGVVKTNYGYHIIKLIKKLPAGSFDELKDQIKTNVVEEKYNKQYQDEQEKWKTQYNVVKNEKVFNKINIII